MLDSRLNLEGHVVSVRLGSCSFMSLSSAILVLTIIWCTIHILSYISTRRSSPILPTSSQPRNSHRRTRIALHSLHLKISTTAWNAYHDTLSSFLARRENNRLNTLFKLIYNLGTIFGAIGIVVAVATLLWICTSSAWSLLQKTRATNSLDIPHLMKRAVSDLETSPVSSPNLEIIPIVSLASPFSLSYKSNYPPDTRDNSPTGTSPHNYPCSFLVPDLS